MSCVSRIPSLGPRGEGWVALQVVALGLVILTARFGRELGPPEPVGSLVRTLGIALILIGVVLLLWGSVELKRGQAFSILPKPIGGGDLVETGPYRFVRNPIYSALVIGALGMAIARFDGWTLASAVVLFAVLDLKRRREEVWLSDRYPGYAAYRRRTKAMVPFLY
jgi:protein-S-isoprenylcysteine O-methyltransferase Ste14